MTALLEMSIDEIMEAEHVVRRGAYELRRREALKVYAADADEKLKKKVVAYLTSHGVQPNLEAVHDLTGGSMDEVGRAVWSLQGDGVVTFYERRIEGISHISAIRLAAGVRAKKHRTPRPATRHPVGVDMTEPKNHTPVAVGGPIEVVQFSGDHAVYVSHIGDGQVMLADPISDTGITEATLIAPREIDFAPREDTPREYSGFPLIRDIFKKQERYARYQLAAELLSTPLGDDFDEYGNDTALRLLEEATLMTDLETEVLRYVESHP